MSAPTAEVQPLADARTDIALLQALREELTRQGRPAHLVRCWLHDEFDVRLLAGGSTDGAPDVELLGPYEAAKPTSRWCAVQVRAEERLVWAGPPRLCAAVDLLRFIDDLQDAEAAELTRGYQRLG